MRFYRAVALFVSAFSKPPGQSLLFRHFPFVARLFLTLLATPVAEVQAFVFSFTTSLLTSLSLEVSCTYTSLSFNLLITQSILVIMGVSNHDRSSPVIDSDPSKESSFLKMEDDTYVDQPWRKAPAPRQSPPKRSRSHNDDGKRVSFSDLHIREYTQVLGDHPCCSIGPPVSLGWDYTDSPRVAVEQYEATRPRRRDRRALRLSWDKRREILSEVPEGDVRRVQRRLNRERCLDNKAIKSFFSTATTASE